MVETTTFIDLMRQHDILWNLKHVDNKNRQKKAKVWRKISQMVGMPVENCKRKWKSLRDAFCREINKRPSSGQEEDEDLCQRWVYYYQMEFLKDHIFPKGNLLQRQEATDGSEYMDETSINSCEESSSTKVYLPQYSHENNNNTSFYITPPKTPPRKALKLNERAEDPLQIDVRILHKVARIEKKITSTMMHMNYFKKRNCGHDRDTEDVEDEDSLFCASLCKKLKRFPLKEKNEMKLKMLAVLCDREQELFHQ